MNHQFISNTYINGFITGLQRLGVDTDRLEADIPDLSIADIREGQRVDINLMRQMWHKAEAITQDPLLGYKVGLNLNIKGLGALTPVLMHSPTIRTSLHNLANYQDLLSESLKLQVTDDEDGTIMFRLIPRYSPIRENSHQVVFQITSMLSMARFMGWDRKSLLKLRLPDDLDIDLFAKKFSLPIEAAPKPPYAIWFSADNADDEIPGTDQNFYHYNKAYVDELLLRHNAGNDLVNTIKSLVIDKGYLKTTIDEVTEELEINKRSLQRRLSEEKTSFRHLKDEIIKERALLQIINTDNTIEQIAADLGYSEVSAFHRAFKGWLGVTPSDYRSNPTM